MKQSLVVAFAGLVVMSAGIELIIAGEIRVPDDHKSIQAAIDAAAVGDVVLVAAGTYKERIRLKPAMTVRSVGDDQPGDTGLKRAEATVIDGGGEIGDGPGVAMAEGATLDGFTVTNVGTYDDAEWSKHYKTQGEEQAHEPIGQPGTAGIGVIGVTCVIRNNIVHHIGYSGIAIQGSEGKRCSPHVFQNVCYRNMGGGIGCMKKSTAIVEENKCFENFYAGIGHDNASPLVIRNQCYGNVRAGIGISEGSQPIVRDNRCYRNRRAGIGVRTGDTTRPVIENNDCYENDMAGIGAREESAPIIRGNRCYRNRLAGIGSRTHATPTIIGNECYENGETGIGQMSNANTILIGNYCHHNGKSGIGFAACESGRSSVLNNRVIDNTLVAVGINPGWTVNLWGNELSRKGGLPPIVMVFAGADATFTNNVISGEGVAGIRVAGTVRAVNNEFLGLSLRRTGPPNFAVWALKGAKVAMSGNTISNWRHALHASEAETVISGNRISDFHQVAIVISQPSESPIISDNTVVSLDQKAQIATINGVPAGVGNNQLDRPSQTDQKR
ncbi:MAG: right-handed parallel beta-helix repeat-containing protein [Planctomycetota bacterium]|nr:right-handed parallel beta-helix repeat-containing protein [Planctomycetota bacterium]MDA1162482.1 right-handed parallel beta-helix repeat-containing protein [Planctomycetota bacterium]